MLIKNLIENFLLLCGGITLFLYGLKLMSDNIQSLAGDKMKRLLSTATGSPVKGVLAGTLVTAVIQSSTATNVMLVGFANAGAITFAKALGVMMGANIGTTVTAQLVSLSGSSLFNVTAVASLMAFTGLLLGLAHRDGVKKTGAVLLGFGMLFIGLEIMNGTILQFRGYAFFRSLFMSKNPVILILNGILITGIVQSSSAVTSIIILLSLNGITSFESSTFLILGTNVGAGIAVLLISTTMTEEAKKIAVANILFNVVGVILFAIPLSLAGERVSALFDIISGGVERKIANFHTVFNVISTLALLPMYRPFANVVSAICTLPSRLKQRERGTLKKRFGRVSL